MAVVAAVVGTALTLVAAVAAENILLLESLNTGYKIFENNFH